MSTKHIVATVLNALVPPPSGGGDARPSTFLKILDIERKC